MVKAVIVKRTTVTHDYVVEINAAMMRAFVKAPKDAAVGASGHRLYRRGLRNRLHRALEGDYQ